MLCLSVCKCIMLYFTTLWFVYFFFFFIVFFFFVFLCFFFFQAEDGIRDLVRSRGLGDVYKRQALRKVGFDPEYFEVVDGYTLEKVLSIDKADQIVACCAVKVEGVRLIDNLIWNCLLYTSDAADERSSVDLGGRRIIKKKKKEEIDTGRSMKN